MIKVSFYNAYIFNKLNFGFVNGDINAQVLVYTPDDT